MPELEADAVLKRSARGGRPVGQGDVGSAELLLPTAAQRIRDLRLNDVGRASREAERCSRCVVAANRSRRGERYEPFSPSNALPGLDENATPSRPSVLQK